MSEQDNTRPWTPGVAPVAVVMISLNEAHNMEAVLANLEGWAQEVFLVDSYSADETVDIALRHGVHVAQRRFRGFGDQWNFALRELPITAPWTMKLDPDERLSDVLKNNLGDAMRRGDVNSFTINIRLWFMGRQLPLRMKNFTRVWRTGACHFSSVMVNEHPLVNGASTHVTGDIEHHDSPNLEHWLHKQNKYTTAEAVSAWRGDALSVEPRLFGSPLQRRMWLKKNFYRLPCRYVALFLYYWLLQGAWRAGRAGYIWARLRADVMRIIEYKVVEMKLSGRVGGPLVMGNGSPDQRVSQHE